MPYLIQTLYPDGQIRFADMVVTREEIREVIEIGSDEPIVFKHDVFINKEANGELSVITRMDNARSIALRAVNRFPAIYPPKA